MKKKLSVLMTVVMALAGAVTASAAEGRIIDGRTLVPVRGVFEEIGFNVEWNAETSTATISDDNNMVEITKGLDHIVVNGETFTPDVPQQIIDGRFYLPLRAVGESVGADVDWDGAAKTAHITYNGKESYVNCGAEEAQTTPAPVTAVLDKNDLGGTWKCDYVYNAFTWEYELNVEPVETELYKGTMKLTLIDTTDPEDAENIGGYYIQDAVLQYLGANEETMFFHLGMSGSLDSYKWDENAQEPKSNKTFKLVSDGEDLILCNYDDEPFYDTNGNTYTFTRS